MRAKMKMRRQADKITEQKLKIESLKSQISNIREKDNIKDYIKRKLDDQEERILREIKDIIKTNLNNTDLMEASTRIISEEVVTEDWIDGRRVIETDLRHQIPRN